jgi:hypothetical protein
MKKADFIIIASVLAVVGILVFCLYFASGNGNYVQIEVDGKVVQTVSINDDTEIEYSTNSNTNTIVVKNGKVSVTNANCPDKICQKHRAISKSGESIICLPHKLVVTVVNLNNDENEIDAVAQ